MNAMKKEEEVTYKITLDGELPKRCSGLFGHMKIFNFGEGKCMLRGKIKDQSALFGILTRIRDLGIPLVSLERDEKNEEDRLKEEKLKD